MSPRDVALLAALREKLELSSDAAVVRKLLRDAAKEKGLHTQWPEQS
jgi:hypothetical protein